MIDRYIIAHMFVPKFIYKYDEHCTYRSIHTYKGLIKVMRTLELLVSDERDRRKHNKQKFTCRWLPASIGLKWTERATGCLLTQNFQLSDCLPMNPIFSAIL